MGEPSPFQARHVATRALFTQGGRYRSEPYGTRFAALASAAAKAFTRSSSFSTSPGAKSANDPTLPPLEQGTCARHGKTRDIRYLEASPDSPDEYVCRAGME